jgi:hypothetical protein
MTTLSDRGHPNPKPFGYVAKLSVNIYGAKKMIYIL